MMRAIESLLPHDPPGDGEKPLADRRELYIEKMDCQYFPDLSAWFGSVKSRWSQTHPADGLADPPAAETDAETGDSADDGAAEGQPNVEDSTASDAAGDPGDGEGGDHAAPEDPGPQGPGWVIELAGHHFHNEPHHKPDEATEFLRSTLIKNLLGKGPNVVVSGGPRAGETVPVRDLGIGYPVIVSSSPVRTVRIASGTMPAPGDDGFDRQRGRAADVAADEGMISLRRYDFVVQFVWQPRTPGGPQPVIAKTPVTEETDN
jgi:type IV pilus assembly protein PilM